MNVKDVWQHGKCLERALRGFQDGDRDGMTGGQAKDERKTSVLGIGYAEDETHGQIILHYTRRAGRVNDVECERSHGG